MKQFWICLFLMQFYYGIEGVNKLENNKYTGITIAINPSIPENPDLITAIQDSWTKASNVLFDATKNRAYIGEVTILVPSSWTSTDADPAGILTYEKADVIIATENPSYGDAPYTLQFGDCGQPGSYIHFTPNYFLDNDMITNYGPREKVIVHEWAHYRWGVFDETSESDPFYIDTVDNGLCNEKQDHCQTRTQCPKKIRICCTDKPDVTTKCKALTVGRTTDCEVDSLTGLYNQDCICFASKENDGLFNASLMSYQYIGPIVTFCEDGNDINSHNPEAPNDQNRLCERKSTWSVIMESDDFKNKANLPISPVTDVKPDFYIKRAKDGQNYVLVLDVSGSMSSPGISTGQTRLEQMRNAANYFITNVANGSNVGIVEFESAANSISPLTKLESLESRTELSAKLPNAANGGTSIGSGIKLGITVLGGEGRAAGGCLLVMTDGEENQPPYVAEVRDEVIDNEVVVKTLFVYTQKNEPLVELSEDSGGDWFFAESDDLLEMVDAYTQMLQPTDGDDTKKSLQIVSESFELIDDTPYVNEADFDKTIGNHTVFTYTWSYGDLPPIIAITPPQSSNCVYSNNPAIPNICDDAYTISKDYKTIRFEIPGIAQTGTWTSYTTRPTSADQTIVLMVTSMAADKDTPPILVKSTLSQKNNCPLVYATVTQGLNPVLNASVEAALSKEGETSQYRDLYDNGADPDIRKDDGVYSRYLCTGSVDGRYSVKVKVYSKSEEGELVKSANRVSAATYSPGFVSEDGTLNLNPRGTTLLPKNTTFGIDSSRLGNFSRQISAGAFEYSAPPPPSGGGGSPSDVFPPSKVLDLKVRQNDFKNFTKGVVLTFTAPGDDFDSGKATRYDIRYTAENINDLLSKFDSNVMIVDDDVMAGNISDPSPAGTVETIVLKTPNFTVEYDKSLSIGYAIRAVDDAENPADASNVAIIKYYFAPPTFAVKTDMTTVSDVTTTPEAETTPSVTTTPEAETTPSVTTTPEAETTPSVTTSTAEETTSTIRTTTTTKVLTTSTTDKPKDKRKFYISLGVLLLIIVSILGTSVCFLVCCLCSRKEPSSKAPKPPKKQKKATETTVVIENPYGIQMSPIESSMNYQYDRYDPNKRMIGRPSIKYD